MIETQGLKNPTDQPAILQLYTKTHRQNAHNRYNVQQKNRLA